MVVTEDRNNARKEVRDLYMKGKVKVGNELARLVTLGNSRYRALTLLSFDIFSGRFNINGNTPSGISLNEQPRSPSVIALTQIYEEIMSERQAELNVSLPPISPIPTPQELRNRPRRPVNLGNAVRNLGAAFSSGITPQIEENNRNVRPWREASLNAMRGMLETNQTRRRNAEERDRALSNLPPRHDPTIRAFQYVPDTFRPEDLTLHQAAEVMETFDFDRNYDLIKSTLLKFSLKIYGLEQCPRRDLGISVYLFIERHFNIQPAIMVCVGPVEDRHEKNVVGVLFQRISTVNHILGNKRVLAKTQYKVSRNSSASWIIWNYDGPQKTV